MVEERLSNGIDIQSHDTQTIIQMLKRIAELEAPKTCDGCKYNKPVLFGDWVCTLEYRCSRDIIDYYEPKGVK